jgi:hypothetical protein
MTPLITILVGIDNVDGPQISQVILASDEKLSRAETALT